MKHTPAPWKINGNQILDRLPEFDKQGARTGNTPLLICTTTIMPNEGESGANARIIALAPAMFDAFLQLALARKISTEAFRRMSYTAEIQDVFDAVEKAEA